MDAENYYEILGIRPGADDEEVKQAYRELAKNFHPDRNPDDEEAERRFKLVGKAYEALKDASRRQTYDEWVAFNEGQKKSHRRQWSRLAAVLALLLLGPSAVLYGVIVFGGPSLFDPFGGQNEAAVSGQSDAADKLADTSKTEAGADTATGPDEKAADLGKTPPVVAKKDVTNAPAKTEAPVEAAPDRAATHITAVGEQQDTPPATINEIRSSIPSNAAEDDGELPNTPGYDAAKGDPSNSGTEKVASLLPGQKAAGEQRENPPASEAGSGDGAENNARASARILAMLKEPSATGSGAAPKVVPDVPEQQVAALTSPQSSSDIFADCEFCPLMSLTRRPKSVLTETNLAVSLSEITVAQWNVCVDDGGCPPYGAEQDSAETPVTGLSAGDASAYAAWLSKRTGQRYRIVMPLALSAPADAGPVSTPGNCSPVGKRHKLNGWDWLEEAPRRNCPPEPVSQSVNDNASGFRVARPIRHEG